MNQQKRKSHACELLLDQHYFAIFGHPHFCFYPRGIDLAAAGESEI